MTDLTIKHSINIVGLQQSAFHYFLNFFRPQVFFNDISMFLCFIIPQVKALCWFRKQARGYAQTGDMILYSGSSYEMILVILVLWQVEAWHFHENNSVPVEAPKQAHIKPKRVLENTVKL